MSNTKKGIIITTAALSLLGLINNNGEENEQSNNYISSNKYTETEKIKTCDGINIISNCEVDGVEYSIYKYYEAIPEQSHIETVTTYTEEITQYCTLCKDGSWSPTCAVGKGACSRHGGVAQYNAPVYSKVPHYEEKKVVDVEASPDRWEKVIK